MKCACKIHPTDGWTIMSACPVHADPWPLFWEQSPAADLCRHQWEMHTTPNGSGGKPENVNRCSICHTPQCGETMDADPCMERRHHRGLHIYRSGAFAPVGGSLRSEGAS